MESKCTFGWKIFKICVMLQHKNTEFHVLTDTPLWNDSQRPGGWISAGPERRRHHYKLPVKGRCTSPLSHTAGTEFREPLVIQSAYCDYLLSISPFTVNCYLIL